MLAMVYLCWKRRKKRYKWRERGHVREMGAEQGRTRERRAREGKIWDTNGEAGGERGKKVGKMKGKCCDV